MAQFVFFLIPATALGEGFRVSRLSFEQLRVCLALACMATTILAGYWIGRRSERRALLVGLSIALMDCAVGACNVNNASINMAVWSVPLMAGAILYRRGRHGLAA